jgi:hypothetical protein
MEEDMNTLLSEFLHGDRKASVLKHGDGYIVKMFQGETLKEARPIIGHTEDYAEEAAENWVMEIIK